jgi:peptidoglycan hydrolase-like amidase/peptidoglycan hydrolase CwlO-like protein
MKRFLLLLTILTLLLSLVNSAPAVADEYDELQREKEQKQQEKTAKEQEKAQAELEQKSIGTQISTVSNQLSVISNQLEEKRAEIAGLTESREEATDQQQQKVDQRNGLWRTLYKRSRAGLLELFLGADTFSALAQLWGYFEASVTVSRQNIQTLNLQINDLTKNLLSANERREQLEGEIAGLETQKAGLEMRHGQLTAYQNELLGQISGLEGEIRNITAKQEELIRQKLAATAYFTSVGEMEQAVQDLPDPPFSPAFAVFSFGYPHRVGMNQYGAYGRSKAGQSDSEIINTYYKGVEIVDYDCPATITVDGCGEVSFEDNYLQGIAEMPSSWGEKGGMEALKAQAIAARTYALATTNNGQSSICATQACQVYRPSKVTDEAAASWHRAVEETRGKVIVYNGSPIKAWYSSTDGGYTRLATDFDVQWNSSPAYIQRVKDLDGEGKAYDGPAHGDSPWFHKAWYDPATDGHPWLTKEELADLFNAALLPESYNVSLSQEVPVITTEPGWSKEEVREALRREGIEPITDFSEVKVAHSDEGYTLLIRVSTPSGTRDIDGRRFRQIFVLRSRGRLALWSSLYEIVQR